MTLGLIYRDEYLEHEHTPTHPERRERLQYTFDQLREEGVLADPAVSVIEPDPATEEDVHRVHTAAYTERLQTEAGTRDARLSPDTFLPSGTYDRAKLAAGGTIEALEAVVEGAVERSFVLSRPGGHHAFTDDAHGFCYLNNTAIGIRAIQATTDVDRVLVWDWDAHHADGTQAIFADDPSVLVISTHQSGRTLFPGTGFPEEIGEGPGEGYTVNVPVPPQTGDGEYLRVVEEIFEPIARQYDHDLLFIEAGQDNHFTDPITNMGVTASGYAAMVERARRVGVAEADGRIVASLAGGYGIESGLPYTNLAVVAGLLGWDTDHIREPSSYKPPASPPAVGGVLEEVKAALGEHWDFTQ